MGGAGADQALGLALSGLQRSGRRLTVERPPPIELHYRIGITPRRGRGNAARSARESVQAIGAPMCASPIAPEPVPHAFRGWTRPAGFPWRVRSAPGSLPRPAAELSRPQAVSGGRDGQVESPLR